MTNQPAQNESSADQKATRHRRSQEEVRASRLEREQRLAQKAEERKQRLLAQAAKADERAKKAMERSQQIESNVTVRVPRPEAEKIKDPVAKRVQRETANFFKELGQKHGLNFDSVTPRMTRQGSGLSFHIVGQVAGAVAQVRRAAGATREASRFLQHHKLVGIKPSLLNKEVQLAGEEGSFKVLGLKGRAHDVVLQKVGTDEIRNMPADEFKSHMVSA